MPILSVFVKGWKMWCREHGYDVEIIEADDPLIAIKRKQGLMADWQRFGIYFSEDLGRGLDQGLVNAIEAIINPEY